MSLMMLAWNIETSLMRLLEKERRQKGGRKNVVVAAEGLEWNSRGEEEAWGS